MIFQILGFINLYKINYDNCHVNNNYNCLLIALAFTCINRISIVSVQYMVPLLKTQTLYKGHTSQIQDWFNGPKKEFHIIHFELLKRGQPWCPLYGGFHCSDFMFMTSK